MEVELKAIQIKTEIAKLINQSGLPYIAAENIMYQILLEIQTARVQQIALNSKEEE